MYRGHHRRWFGIAAVVALTGDLLLLAASVLHRSVSEDGPLGWLTLGRWNGNRDGTFVELWGGVHLALAAGALLMTALVFRRGRGGQPIGRRGSDVLVAWAAVLIAIAADDYFMIHERVGAVLVDALGLPAVFGMRGQDLGELVVWVVLASALGVLLVVGHLRAGAGVRRDSLVLLALTFFLAAAGVVLDMLNIALHDVVSEQTQVLTIHLETGGELVAMTLLLLWSLRILDRATTGPGIPTSVGNAEDGARGGRRTPSEPLTPS